VIASISDINLSRKTRLFEMLGRLDDVANAGGASGPETRSLKLYKGAVAGVILHPCGGLGLRSATLSGCR